MYGEYFDEATETARQTEMEAVQVRGFNRTLHIGRKCPLYAEALRGAPHSIRGLEDLVEFPLTTKEDLRRAYPFGGLAVDPVDIVYYRRTSGTSGKPVAVYFTREDIRGMYRSHARNYHMTGIRRADRVQLAVHPQITLLIQGGLMEMGSMVVVTGTGNDLGQLSTIEDLDTTTIFGVPSYLLHLGEMGEGRKLDSVKRVISMGEPLSLAMRRKVGEAWGAEVFDNYGSAEMAAGNYECKYHCGHHVLWDDFLMETVDPDTGEPTEGHGELVFTTLRREGTPLIRYRTGDLVELVREECDCGRTSPRVFVKGRMGEMIKVRGTSLYPSAIREALHGIREITNFQIVIDREASLDRLTLRIEAIEPVGDLSERIVARIKATTNLTPRVEFVQRGSLRGETKTREVVDLRGAR